MTKYLKPGAEEVFTEDNTEIQYLKFNMVRHVALGYMLGDFDERGEYNIDPEIVSELLAMPKYFVDNMENIDICHSALVLNGPLTFLVTIENDTATLSLIEKINYEGNFKFNSGSYSNINEYILDVVATNGNINKEAIYRRWNISQFGGEALDIRNLDEEQLQAYYGLVARFKYLTYVNAMFAEKEAELEAAEATYANDMLSLLEQYPELKSAVIEQVKEALEKTEILRLDKPNFAKTLNEAIDTAIENNIQQLPQEKQKDFATQRDNIQLARNVKVEQTIPLEISHIDINNKEIAIGSPKVQTFNEETTLSFYALDEQLKIKQAAAEQQAQIRAVEVLVNRNVPKKQQGVSVGTALAILAGTLLGGGQDLFNNVGDATQKRVTETLDKNTTAAPRSMLGKAATQEQGKGKTTADKVEKQTGTSKTTGATTKKPDGKNSNKSAKPTATKKGKNNGGTTDTKDKETNTANTTNRNASFNPYNYNPQPKDKNLEGKTNVGPNPKEENADIKLAEKPKTLIKDNLRNEIEERLAKLRENTGETAIGANRPTITKEEVGKVEKNDLTSLIRTMGEKPPVVKEPETPNIGIETRKEDDGNTTEIGLTK